MKTEIVEKISGQVEQWEHLNKLPANIHGFELKILGEEEGDKYHIFSYENSAKHCLVKVYYHQETKEFKLRVQIGLTDFCVVEYISDNLEEMEEKLISGLEKLLTTLVEHNNDQLSCLVRETGVLNWEYTKELPEKIAGFELFIAPDKPIRTINGSYIILDYSNFSQESNFIILYNILREEFSAEMKFHNIPEITYEFDVTNLEDLELSLKEKLLTVIQGMQDRLDKE